MANTKFWSRIFVVMLLLGFTGIGYTDDSHLNGTWIWINDLDHNVEGRAPFNNEELKFNNGNIEISRDNIPIRKGTYTTSGGNMTITITHFWGIFEWLDSKWYSKNELEAIFKGTEMTEAEIATYLNMYFFVYTSIYSIIGNKLTIISSSVNTTTYTRK